MNYKISKFGFSVCDILYTCMHVLDLLLRTLLFNCFLFSLYMHQCNKNLNNNDNKFTYMQLKLLYFNYFNINY